MAFSINHPHGWQVGNPCRYSTCFCPRRASVRPAHFPRCGRRHSLALVTHKDSWFRRVSCSVATGTGSHWAFLLAVLVVVAWAATGPLFHFSDTWQLVINTGT